MSEWVTLRVGGRDDAMSAQNQCNESYLIDLYHAQASSNDRKDDKRTEKQKTKRPIRNLFISLPCPCPCTFRTSSNITITYELNCCAHSTSIHHSLRRAVPATATTTGNIADAFSWKLPTFTAFVSSAFAAPPTFFPFFLPTEKKHKQTANNILIQKQKHGNGIMCPICVSCVWVNERTQSHCSAVNANEMMMMMKMKIVVYWWCEKMHAALAGRRCE